MRMLRWMCGVTKKDNMKRTCERISESSTGDREGRREKAKVVRTC